jgi:hypothetical protein
MNISMSLRALTLTLLLTAAGSTVANAVEGWTVCFTPGEDCTGLIVKELGKAKHEIEVQAYSFTSAPIAKALTVCCAKLRTAYNVVPNICRSAKIKTINAAPQRLV